jgi:HAD superfamily hydrolase (TIGR01509 family)
MVKAIVWDMDVVVVDSEDHHHAGEIATFKHFGVEIPEEINKQYKGTPLREHFQGLKNQFNVETPLEELLDKQNEHIHKMYSEEVELFANVKEVLTELRQNYRQSLATSSERKLVEVILKRFGIQDLFDEVTCGDEVSRGKPDPEIFLKTAEKLNLLPEECVVIEDSFNGIKAGKLAGMKVIAHKVHHNQEVDFSMADYVIGDLKEVSGILERLNNV